MAVADPRRISEVSERRTVLRRFRGRPGNKQPLPVFQRPSTRERRKLQTMKIERVELREIRAPLVAPFETSFGRTTGRRIILVKVFSEGLVGWGECTVGENPFYNHESTESCWMII